MKRVHPKLSCSAIRAAIAFSFVVAGCRSSSSGVAGNPFMSPDRVPPPNTRALLPGQAQPYYQGDPLPAMQSATKPAANAIAANPAETDSRSSTGRTLAWSQPGTAAPAPTSVAPPQAIAATNEASVAVPTDANPLRFPLPTPREPGTVAPIAAAAPPQNIQPIQPAAAQQQPNVLLASYNAPVPIAPPIPVNPPPMIAPQQVASPWRSPQVAQATTPPSGVAPLALPAPPIGPLAQPQVAIPPNTMAATLRAVESPAEPGDPMPRVRVPGFAEPQIQLRRRLSSAH